MTEDPGWRRDTRQMITDLQTGLGQVLALAKATDLALDTLTTREDESTAAFKLKDYEQDRRLDRLEGGEEDPGWTLIADVPVTADPMHGWSPAYNGLGNPSQGPRWKGHVERTEFDSKPGLRFHSKPVTEDTTINGGYVIKAGEYASAGIMLTGTDIGPGNAWEVELRSLCETRWTRMANLTWPYAGWPRKGEIDYVERGGDPPRWDQQTYDVSNWYQPDGGDRAHDGFPVACDLTLWHTYRVEWVSASPDERAPGTEDDGGLLIFYVDGAEVRRLTRYVPAGPHRLAFQTALEGGPLAREGTTPGGSELRAVRIYQHTEGR